MENKTIILTAKQQNGRDTFAVPRVFYLPEASLLGPPIPGVRTLGGITASFTKVEYQNAEGNKESVFVYETPLEIEASRDLDPNSLKTVPVLATGLAAAGTTQGNGTAITKTISEFDAIGAGATEAADLPAATVGAHFIIINNDADAALKIFPASGETIDNQVADAVYSLAVGKRVHLYCDVAGAWLVAKDLGV